MRDRLGGIWTAIAILVALLLPATSLAQGEPVETEHVAELRATVAQVTAATDEVKALRGAGGGSVWRLTATEVNPANRETPQGQTIAAADGHTNRTFDVDPTTDFNTDWPSPPAILRPSQKYEFEVTVAGAITGGTTVQGFRTHDAILIVNDRWDGSTAVGAGQSCNDPIGTAPISCTGPQSNADTFTVNVSSATSLRTFSFGISALNCSACYVRYTYTATTARGLARGAGGRLLAAIQRARATLRLYLNADTRHGTAEEHRLVDQMLASLRTAAVSYGRLAGSPIRTTPRKVPLARKLVRAISDQAAEAAVERWPGIERIAALLKNPRRADRAIKREIQRELAAELNRRRAAVVRSALADRIPIQLGVPIRTQVRNAAERFLLRRLSRALFKIDKRGLLVEFFGRQVRVAIQDIALAARPTGNVQRRTDITLAGYERRQAALDELLPVTSSKLDDVRQALFEAEGAFQAARLLRRDLADLVATRCRNPAAERCEGAKITRDRLAAADEVLAAKIVETKGTFLIGKEFDPSKLRSWIAGLGRMAADVRRANRKLG